MRATTTPARAFSCSPRANGNSDRLAALFARGFAEAGGNIEVTLMRQYEVRPCVSCYRCQHDPHGWCFLEGTDRSAPLFSMLFEAPALFFAAPVFFYHLPAMFKAFIDRGQSYWLRREAGDERLLSLPRRTAWVALVAGRKKGERIFDGSLLTLRYFLAAERMEASCSSISSPPSSRANSCSRFRFWRGAASSASASMRSMRCSN